ncbi:hypothetical protein NE562_17420 [Butyricicoccus faecihominis]|uniref:hypothetical protein n=1 Tax=Butyricicoccus faecihominis TaxID=1712515 RepID=UPI00247B0120|nr:hypothetical protein [Butyricicoccus faecihominis]MCQ5131435.1 hypothetical protein [Butyricicoccus faecihominis]
MVDKANKREIMRSVKDSNINYAVELQKVKPDEKTRREIAAAKRSVLVRGD